MFTFVLFSLLYEVDPKGYFCNLCKSILTMFSSRSFILSDLTFRSLIYLILFGVYGVRECSNFILLHVAVQFSQYHLLNRL